MRKETPRRRLGPRLPRRRRRQRHHPIIFHRRITPMMTVNLTTTTIYPKELLPPLPVSRSKGKPQRLLRFPADLSTHPRRRHRPRTPTLPENKAPLPSTFASSKVIFGKKARSAIAVNWISRPRSTLRILPLISHGVRMGAAGTNAFGDATRDVFLL
jgi:hypothetical protein